MENEVWKDIPNYEGLYLVSNLGSVKSLKFNKEKILKKSQGKVGYYVVCLCKDRNIKRFSVHQLVAMAFLGHTPCGYKFVVDHINDNQLDNRVENLQVVTQRYNAHKTQGKSSSKYKGVSYISKTGKWQSTIYLNKKNKNLGNFTTEEEAHLVYQNKLKEVLS